MIDITKLTDPYERKARLYPALLCILPIVVSISISYPEIYSTLSGLIALVMAFGGLFLMSHLARDRGKNLEKNMFTEWGGIPSVCIFRYSSSLIPRPAKVRYHQILEEQTGIEAPTEETENNDPVMADEIYLSWSNHLRGKTRDEKKYALLFKENINYGFRRNFLGIKWYSVISGVVGLGLVVYPKLPVENLNQTDWSIIIMIISYILVCAITVNKKWVKTIAIEYAKRLVEAIKA